MRRRCRPAQLHADDPNFWANVARPADVDKMQGDQFMPRSCTGDREPAAPAVDQRPSSTANGYFFAAVPRRPTRPRSAASRSRSTTRPTSRPAFYCDNGQPARRPTPTGRRQHAEPVRRRRRAHALRAAARRATGRRPTAPATATIGVGHHADHHDVRPRGRRSTTQNPLQAPVIGCCQTPVLRLERPGVARRRSSTSKTACATSITDRTRYQQLHRADLPHGGTRCARSPGRQRAGRLLPAGAHQRPRRRRSSRHGRPRATTASEQGQGANRFAMRARSTGDRQHRVGRLASSTCRSSPTTAGSPTATFNLIRVLPGAAGKCIKFTFFDVGDAATDTARCR